MDMYDIDIMKTNIKKIMANKNISQVKLSEETKIPQPTLSDVLSKKNSHSFTIIQLVSIANALESSVDDILGTKKKVVDKSDIRLSDILKSIFDIDKRLCINVAECETDEFKVCDDFTGEIENMRSSCIYFKNKVLSGIIKEWGELKNANISQKATADKIMQLWENETISKCQERKSCWEYRNKFEQGEFLAKNYLKYLYDNSSYKDLYNPGNEYILKEYVSSLSKHPEYLENSYDDLDYENLLNEVRRYSFMNIPDEIDDELPFE